MDYWTVTETARAWGLSSRRVRVLCEQEKIVGVLREGTRWRIPAHTLKPVDGRVFRQKEIPAQFQEVFAEIDAMKAELARRRPLTVGELQHLRETFLVEYTYASNAIEGNTLTLQETALVLEGITIDQKPLREHLEAIGHRDAFNYLEAVVQTDEPLSEDFIKKLHSLVLADRPEDKGIYRRIPVRITGAAHTPPQPYRIANDMEALLAETAVSKLHPLAKAALFHIRFEAIHPFIDGNGRTGRLLMNFMLMRHGYLPISIKFTNRKAYYNAFTAYHQDGTADPMTALISNYERERLAERLTQINHV